MKILGWYVAAVLAFLALPVLVVIPSALSAGSTLGFPPQGLSLKWFRNVVDHPEFLRALAVSVEVAAASTVLALGLGTLAAFAFVRYRFAGRDVLQLAFVAPLVFPAIVYGVAMLMMLTPLKLTRTMLGLTLAHVVITLPYVLRTVGATLHGVDRRLEESAQILGAGPWRTFWHVTLPLIRPGLIAGATFSLIISFDEFTVSLFLTGPGLMTLPLEIYHYTEFTIDPTIAAISTVLIVLSVATIMAIERFLGFERHFQV
ncbi:MAG: ABC transporter permease [Candidatus Rokubacteria bacterium]|nr:ABC transporter permease [Candidatus Rokubacteria bacterium]MBI3827354.1 ABC transporter permease [Candidatus Rokubacteria bacterium]